MCTAPTPMSPHLSWEQDCKKPEAFDRAKGLAREHRADVVQVIKQRNVRVGGYIRWRVDPDGTITPLTKRMFSPTDQIGATDGRDA